MGPIFETEYDDHTDRQTMAEKGPERPKGLKAKECDVATTDVIIGCTIVGSSCVCDIEITGPNEALPDKIGRVDDNGLFVKVDSTLRPHRYYARHAVTKGDAIYALRAVKFGDMYVHTTKVWIGTERATTEETENDILRKVSPLYEGISLEAGSFKDLCKGMYAELSNPPAYGFTRRRIQDFKGCYVGDITVIMLM